MTLLESIQQRHMYLDARSLRVRTLQAELDAVTGELINTQDQILAMSDLHKTLRGCLELDSLLQAIAQQALRLIPVESAVCILDASGVEQHRVAGKTILSGDAASALLKQLQAHKRPLLLRAAETLHLVSTDGVSLLCVPVEIRGHIGAVLAWVTRKDGQFAPPDVKLGQAIAVQVGAAIENVLLYHETLAQARSQRELELARDIQQRMVPHDFPSVSGLDIHATMRPAQQVGGDFYDWMQLPQGDFTFAVGDVSGKGMSAALVMSMLRTGLRSAARQLPPASPAGIVAHVTSEIYDDLTDFGMFATTFVGVWNAAESKLTFANMGHAPVIYIPHDGKPCLLEADSPPLGVLDYSMAQNHTLVLSHGDALIVATDGYTQARDASDTMLGIQGLFEPLAQYAHGTAREICERLAAVVAAHSRDKVQDDQTLVVLKRI